MIALVVMTDGRRDCIEQTIPSAEANLRGPISERWIHDDSGEPDHRAWLVARFPHFTVIGGPRRQGFGGAIRSTWEHLRHHSTAPYLFWLEDDFTFHRCVDLRFMADVLDGHPYLVQLALRRQPWNDAERAAGGIVQQHPDAYEERLGLWLEHRLFYTTNPSLYRRSLILEHDWPDVPQSEGIFTHHLLEDPAVRFGFWGARQSGEWVTHIGRERVGTGY